MDLYKELTRLREAQKAAFPRVQALLKSLVDAQFYYLQSGLRDAASQCLHEEHSALSDALVAAKHERGADTLDRLKARLKEYKELRTVIAQEMQELRYPHESVLGVNSISVGSPMPSRRISKNVAQLLEDAERRTREMREELDRERQIHKNLEAQLEDINKQGSAAISCALPLAVRAARYEALQLERSHIRQIFGWDVISGEPLPADLAGHTISVMPCGISGATGFDITVAEHTPLEMAQCILKLHYKTAQREPVSEVENAEAVHPANGDGNKAHAVGEETIELIPSLFETGMEDSAAISEAPFIASDDDRADGTEQVSANNDASPVYGEMVDAMQEVCPTDSFVPNQESTRADCLIDSEANEGVASRKRQRSQSPSRDAGAPLCDSAAPLTPATNVEEQTMPTVDASEPNPSAPDAPQTADAEDPDDNLFADGIGWEDES
jgi:hypothetical protein